MAFREIRIYSPTVNKSMKTEALCLPLQCIRALYPQACPLIVIIVGETQPLRKCAKISKGGPDAWEEQGLLERITLRDNEDSE